MVPNLKQMSLFYMKLTHEDKLKMCEGNILRGKSLSHISEENGNYDISNLKYLLASKRSFE